MERDRKTRVIAIFAMVFAVAGLTIGYAAFTKTLNIQFTNTTVQGNSANFSVKLSSSATAATTSPVPAGVASPTASGPTALAPTLNATTISGLGATFSAPGQSITYTFYAVNDGQFDAYLKSITIADAAGATGKGVACTADTGASATMVANACKAITMTVTIGSDVATATSSAAQVNKTSGITSAAIAKKSGTTIKSHTVVVKLDYASTANLVDGNFTVKFGNVTLNYATQ